MIDRQKAVIAPDFSLSDSEGRKVQLSTYKGQKNLVLVFNRGFT